MSYVGVAVRIVRGRPHLRGVVLDEPSVGAVRTFDYLPPAGVQAPDMIRSVADGLAGQLAGVESAVLRLVIRQADDGRHGGMTAGRVLRARAEGAIAYVAKLECSDVQILDGPAIGRAFGGSLASAESSALQIVAKDWMVAASAALAARSG